MWPAKTVTNLNPFRGGEKNFTVTAELLNDQGRVIASQNISWKGTWSFEFFAEYLPVRLTHSSDGMKTVVFGAVKADDITDALTIRITKVNGVDAQTAARNGDIQITTPGGYWGDEYEFKSGTLTRYKTPSKILVIPDTIWGEPVTCIKASMNDTYNKFTTFEGVEILTIPNSVTRIDGRSDSGHYPCSIFHHKPEVITLPANIDIVFRFMGSLFDDFYNSTGKKAGTYVYSSRSGWRLKK
jgi:hypothetical protein